MGEMLSAHLISVKVSPAARWLERLVKSGTRRKQENVKFCAAYLSCWEENCFFVCKSNFCSSRQMDSFYTTSQVLYVLLRDMTVPKCSLTRISYSYSFLEPAEEAWRTIKRSKRSLLPRSRLISQGWVDSPAHRHRARARKALFFVFLRIGMDADGGKGTEKAWPFFGQWLECFFDQPLMGRRLEMQCILNITIEIG